MIVTAVLKRHLKKTITIAALLGAVTYLYWPGFSVKLPEAPNNTVTFENHGNSDSASINVVSIAPVMQPEDYATGRHFKAKLNDYFDAAKEKGWFNDNTIVVLPAHIGTPLLATGHKSRVYSAASIKSAMIPLLAYNLPAFLKNYYVFDAEDPLIAATIRAQTKNAADTYQIAFSAIAQNYGVTIVAGSMLMMTPGIYPDGITYGHGPIFHASFVFGPDGKPQGDAIRQATPNAAEQHVAKKSLAEFIPTFSLNGIKYAVVIGSDTLDESVNTYLKSQNIDLLLSPQFHIAGDTAVNSPFGNSSLYPWAVSSSMNGKGWGISVSGSTAFANSNEYSVSQTSDNNIIIQNIWITK
ncbi:carbon-nitrogen hydrolase family protein [Kordiimonas aquimaris]|uniref:hypothetical protein n=1 Tax=Kordiimonas aquimaris TaxID=707591 RepID=UPI0021CFCE4C|nr:hypothetical protein [Kordiimonas aquimaris]